MRIDAGKTSLICLPFAGSGAGFYRAWVRQGTGTVEVLPLQVPGREERFVEPPPTDLVATAKQLAQDALRMSEGKGSVALFGHSLGAVLAYETTRELLRIEPTRVRHLFVSGSPGPWTKRSRRATGLDDEAFLAQVSEFADYRHQAFENLGLRKVLLPILRADVAIHEEYAPPLHEPLKIPVTALRGANDRLVSPEQAAEWRATTTARFTTAEIPGGHMYLTGNPTPLLDVIGQFLCEHEMPG